MNTTTSLTGLGNGVGTEAAKLGVQPPMQQADVVESAGGGDRVLFWTLAIGGLIFSLTTGKRRIRLF